ncbi:MAG: Omp28-related outer membrane protein [Bacteroidia bacterium]|nr:Omp28-related outer membrane protein [Bacteroidia bacterium]
MKKIYMLAGAAMLFTAANAQSTFSDDFEAYSLGAYIGPGTQWTTWSGAAGEGTTEDATVVNTQASSGTQSAYFMSTAANGGPQDVVLPFGGQYNTGNFTYEMNMYVAANKGAYFNFQGQTTVGALFAMECYLPQTGAMILTNTNGTLFQGTYPNGQWFNLRFDINLNTNSWNVYIDNVLQGTFSNTVNQIASIDIFGYNGTNAGGNGQAEFWIDDVSYTHTPYNMPVRNGAVIACGAIHPATRQPASFTGIVGQQKRFAATVRNLGTSAITSFDISYTYNSNTVTQTISSVNIASLASYTVEFNNPATLIAGTNPILFVVSNVNAQGADLDLTDDSSTFVSNITVVPAAGKVVLGEEGTGTWCQWCPRGAVYMDYMAETYDGFWAGVAVHNGDPMVVSHYDAGIGGLIQGYPSGVVDRMPESDPSDFENEFLNRVIVPPHAIITNGAQYSANGDTLKVSLTYNFGIAATSSYKVACVLVEDSVTGTTGYNQSNAYANNAAGPMGGFETLPSSVPASQMNYNHVARNIMPSFTGATGLPATVTVGSTHTFNFTFVLGASWDTAQFHIVGLLFDPAGDVDNASSSSVAEAITNGYVTGTNIVGLSETPAQPDAFDIYPNPANGFANASIILDNPQEVIMTIRDVTGKVVAQRNYGELSGAQILPINTTELAEGMYTVEIATGETVRVSQLIVQ